MEIKVTKIVEVRPLIKAGKCWARPLVVELEDGSRHTYTFTRSLKRQVVARDFQPGQPVHGVTYMLTGEPGDQVGYFMATMYSSLL